MNKLAFGLRFSVVALALGLGATLPGNGAYASEAPKAADAMSLPVPRTGGPVIFSAPIPVCVPIGLAISKNDLLYVANHWTTGPNCGAPGQITVYDTTGTQLTARTITKGIYNPAGLAFDSLGNLYVVDATKQKVTVYDPNGVKLTGMTLHTDPNYSPSGVQVDSQGNVWVANRTNNNITIGEIQIFHKNGTIDAFTQGLVYPLGIVFTAGNGNAWVGNSETPNDALTTYSPTGAFLHQFPTSGFTPTYLAFAKNGHLYATDGLHSLVEIFNHLGQQIGPTITQGLNLPYGIAFDSIGNFYVANVGTGGRHNGSSITKYNSSGTLICTIKKSGCL